MENHPSDETLKVIHRRHSVRQFRDKPVDDSLIKAILDAANKATSAHNQQSWRFIVVRGEKKQPGLVPAAVAALIEKLGGTVVEMAFIVDLPDVGGKKKLQDKGYKVYALTEFEGD